MRVEFTVEVRTLAEVPDAVVRRLSPFFGETPYRFEVVRVTPYMTSGVGETLSWLLEVEADQSGDF